MDSKYLITVNITSQALVGILLPPQMAHLYGPKMSMLCQILMVNEERIAPHKKIAAELPELANLVIPKSLSFMNLHVVNRGYNKNVFVSPQDKKLYFWYSRESSGLGVEKPGV